jgi:hypothetical protein
MAKLREVEDSLLQLRSLTKAVRVLADGLDDNYVGDAFYAIANSLDAEIEKLPKKKKGKS